MKSTDVKDLTYKLSALYAARESFVDFADIEPFKSDLEKIDKEITRIELILGELSDERDDD